MEIGLLIIFIFLLFKYVQARYQFSKMSEKNNFYLLQIEQKIIDNPKNPILYCSRGTIFMRIQNLPKAREDFRRALLLVEEGVQVIDQEKLIKNILLNITYTEKPLPWSKNCPKDYTGNTMFYFLVVRFGAMRFNFKI
jgi:hypothetical protein